MKLPVTKLYMLMLFVLGGALLPWLSSCTTTKQDSDEQGDTLPNIVIIFTDDQGYQDVGAYGSPDIQTPNLDRMAREGARFTNFYVAQPVCSASRAALMTGCYPSRVGIMGALGPNSQIGLAPAEMTIAELLKQKNYATAIYGKWHLGDLPPHLPTQQGFDTYYGIPYSNDMWPYHPERPDGYPPLKLMEDDKVIDTLEDQSMITTEYTERAVDFIDEHKDQPFFLYLAHSMPHVPLFVSDQYKGKSDRGLYGDVIMEIDWSVGQVMEALERNGVDENTWVIFMSDNGPWLSYGDHAGSALPLREGKGTSLEGGVRVPGIMRWPGKIPADQVVEQPVMTIDLFPTIANVTGTSLPEQKIDGMNVWPLITQEAGAENPHEAYFFYYRQNELQGVLSGDGRWKLYLPHTYRTLNGREGGTGGIPVKYEYNNLGMELYDLDNDISETTDVSGQHPEVVERLLALADSCRAELGDKLTEIEGSGVRR